MSLTNSNESFSKDLILERYSKDINGLRVSLLKFTKLYNDNKNYKTSDTTEISDLCNKLRYFIEQYCFHLNILQDFIQISIPIDPFVDVLDIFPSEELPAFKQKHLLQLLRGNSSNETQSFKTDFFNDYDKRWFDFMIKHINFILESYNFLKHWEAGYNNKIMKKLEIQKENLLKPTTENKLYKKYLDFKESIEKEKQKLEDSSEHIEAKDASDKVSALTFKDKLKDKNQMITKSLVRSNQILKSTVLQTELNLEEIFIQGNLLTDLNDKFDILDTLLSQSSKLMKMIEKNGSKEKRQVYYSLGFLIACVSWVIWKRLVRGPIKLLIWIWFNFFKRILYFTGFLKRNKVIVGEPIFQEITSIISESTPIISSTLSSLSSSSSSSTSSIIEIASNISSVIADTAVQIASNITNNSSNTNI